MADLGSIAESGLLTFGSELGNPWETPTGAERGLMTYGMILDGVHGHFWELNDAERGLMTYGMQLDGIHGPPWDNNGAERGLQTYGSTETVEIELPTATIEGGSGDSQVQADPTAISPPPPEPHAPAPILPPDILSTIIQCLKAINTCLPCNDDPLLNISAEAPDSDRFISNYQYIGERDLRLGWTFGNLGFKCIQFSTVSQSDADEAALRCAQETTWSTWRDQSGTPLIFLNQSQQCTVTCNDGSTFTWSIAGGTVAGFSRAEANARAHALACQRAAAQRICVNTEVLAFCKGVNGTKTLEASGGTPFQVNSQNYVFIAANCPGQVSIGQTLPHLWTSTDLPTGLELNSCNGQITGTPTVTGTTNVIVRATDALGSWQERTIPIHVVEITNENPLPDGTPLEHYLQNLSTSVGDQEQQTWTVISGTLPPGLSLTTAGVLSGTPTDVVATGYIFTVQVVMTDINGTCTKEFMMTIVGDTFLDYQDSGYKYLQIAFEGTPPAGWAASGFDDSLWSDGTAAFGGGSMTCPLMSTVATTWAPDSDLLVRRTVGIPAGTTGVQIKVAVDNDIVELYWNGTLITSAQSHDFCPTLDNFSFNVPDGLLLPGANKLAIWVRDRGGPSFVDMRVIA